MNFYYSSPRYNHGWLWWEPTSPCDTWLVWDGHAMDVSTFIRDRSSWFREKKFWTQREGYPRVTHHQFIPDSPKYDKNNTEGWIDVGERLPEKDGAYLVGSIEGGYPAVSYYDCLEDEWSEIRSKLPITHWQKLPEPPVR